MKDQYNIRKNYPIDLKIKFSKNRIHEWLMKNFYKCFISFSGGKNSIVLYHLVYDMYKDIKLVYVNNKMEGKNILQFIYKNYPQTEIIYPEMFFDKIFEEYGIPFFTRNIANEIKKLQNNLITLEESNLPQKYKKFKDYKIKISDECCNISKIKPLKDYIKKNNLKPFIGNINTDRHCNDFDSEMPTSAPLSFWTEEDIETYIKEFNLKICEDYKIFNNKTECLICPYGLHIEKENEENRLQKLKKFDHNLYFYVLNNTKLKYILEYMNIKYE